jgi:GntR family transcriptional repressor for pyruvate dehydrogenase complex
MFRTVGDKSRLVDRVVDEIENLIVNGQLAPGMKLPPERELVDQLGVSRTVVREAVHILVAKGLLDPRQGVGTIVRQVTRDQVFESLDLLLRTSPEGVTFEHLYQIRSILEVEIAGLAADQATADDIENLRRIVAEMESALTTPKLLASTDIDFHRALAQITRNPLLVVFVDLIRDLMQEYSELINPHIDPRQYVLPDHLRITERIAAKDVAGARQAMRDHLKQVLENYKKYLASGTAGVSQPDRL